MNKKFHISVLLKEIIELLSIKSGNKYIDATIGGGGHTTAILEHGGIVLGIDLDQEALDYVQEKIKDQKSKIKNNNLVLAKGNFRDIDRIAKDNGFEKVSGIIFDLGVSSFQLDTKKRGFSFQRIGPLDMRMDQRLAVKARDLVNALSSDELYELFTKLGEEHNARAISNNIVRARRVSPIETTTQLVQIIEQVSPNRFSKINFATQVFQALRIAVNDELNNLKEALPKAISLLEKNGLLIIISFHSLEDRIVKRAFEDFENQNKGLILTKKPIMASLDELEKNKRSRSAKLRALKKLS